MAALISDAPVNLPDRNIHPKVVGGLLSWPSIAGHVERIFDFEASQLQGSNDEVFECHPNRPFRGIASLDLLP